MKTTMKTQIKTKTIVAVAIAVLAAGSVVLGLTFVSSRTGQTLSGNPYTGTASQTGTSSDSKPISYIGPPVRDDATINSEASENTTAAQDSPRVSNLPASPVSGIDLAFNKATKGELGKPCMMCDELVADLSVYGYGLTHNGKPINVTMGVKNYGTDDAGPFTVKIWKSVDTIPGNVNQDASKDCEKTSEFYDKPDALLATWNINGLKTGESIRKTFENMTTSGWPIHKYFTFIIEIDADDNVAETNESNNVFMRKCMVQAR